jgi:chromate transporter
LSVVPGRTTKLRPRDLFWIFLKAGLAFGGGLGILAVLEDEFVSKRGLVSRDDFLALYGLGRVVPSGTMTALAVVYGYQFGGMLGTLVALAAMTLPALTLTILFTVAYGLLKQGHVLNWLEVSVLPAALAFIVAAAVKLGRTIFSPSIDLALAVGAFVAAVFLNINPSILLVAGGVLGIFAFWKRGGAADDPA